MITAPPASAAAPCPPYGPLDCLDLVVDLDDGFALDFTGAEGGLAATGGVGTGFTLVQPKATSGDPYLPASLAVSGGALAVTTTAGIAFNTTNSQDNALGVALPVSSRTGAFDVRTTLVAPPTGNGRFEQAGLWFGPTQDIFVKTEIISAANNGQVQVEIAVENVPSLPSTTATPPTQVRSAAFAPGAADVGLRLRVDPVGLSATAYYQLGAGAETVVGSVPLPQRLVDGSAVPSPPPGAVNLAGIYATHRNRGNSPALTPATLTYRFGSFSVSEPAPSTTTPPVDVRVDFGTQAMTPAAGYLLDYGQAYGPRTGVNQGAGLTFGWIDQDEGGVALSLVGNGRTRGRAGVEPRSDSFIHAQYADVSGGTNGVSARGTWELAVPDGTYQVTVGVGDQPSGSTYDSVHAVNIEAAAALISFVGTAAAEYRTVTTTVAVRDGRLTVSPEGGTNTKIGYVDVAQVPNRPRIAAVTPGNRTIDAGVDDGVAADIAVPGVGVGVSAASLTSSTVELFELVSGAKVAGSSNTSGGNDTVNFAPAQNLKPFTAYRFEVRAGVLANDGTPFLPFTSVFTTGTDVVTVPGSFTPLTNVGFTKVDQPAAAGSFISSMAFGPDGKLYAATIGGGLKRWTVAADGTLSAQENLSPALVGRAVIGLVFDQGATATNLKVWVTHATANLGSEASEWSSKVSVLSGPTLSTVTDVFVGLPRSAKDHLSNSLIYGPDGDLYFPQGSNQSAGDPDSAWGNRGEKLLTAAVLNFDPDNAQVAAAVAGGAPINVQTADIATPYNPYATNAPLTIYATGVRNAYDLVWHSNGRIYAPTNGTAGGGNSPGIDVTYSGTTLTGAVRRAGVGTPTGATIEGTSLLSACQARLAREPGRTLVDVPAVFNHNKQRDFLFNVTEGGYYGHPNPLRCEFVLNNGANAEGIGENGTKYPAGVAPDPNYRGWAYDFAFNKSPNGVIEYRSNTFGGQLKGRLVVVRFSNNNDLEFIQVDPATGQSLGSQTAQGFTSVPNSRIAGVDGFLDPLEIVEDPRTGNLYVNQYDQSGNQQKLVLLRVPAGQGPPPQSTATLRVNFANAAAPVPTGYVRDYGQAYGPRTSTDQGTGLTYGWLDPTSRTPIDLSVGGSVPGNGRDRNLNADQRYDTFMHMTPTDVPGTFNGTKADGSWEATVPNGTYRVTVAAGDPLVTSDSTVVERHSLVVEGVPAITDFVGTGAAGSATRHATATVDVIVADGRLTVDAGPTGSNVKINFIDVVPRPTSVQVDFAPATSPVPTGWVADTGAAFTTARGYGWLNLSGQPLDRTNAARERAANAAASTIDSTLVVMQSGATAGVVTGNWEYALPNGTYNVELSVGDQNFSNSTHSVDIEGTRVISGFVPMGPGDYQVVARDITVADGRLTVAAGSNGVNTKIQWISITARP